MVESGIHQFGKKKIVPTGLQAPDMIPAAIARESKAMNKSFPLVSRRRFCHLLLGGSAAALGPGGLLVSAAQAREEFSDGLARGDPVEQGVPVRGIALAAPGWR